MTVCSGSSRHLQARWEQGPAPLSEEEGQHGAELSLPGEGGACGSAWKKKKKEKDTHTGAAQGSGGGMEIRGCGPRLVELRQTTEVTCCESGKKLVSSVSSAEHQPYPGQAVAPEEVCPPPACEGAGGHKMLQVPGTLLPAPRAPQPSQLLPQRLSERLSAGLVWTPA